MTWVALDPHRYVGPVVQAHLADRRVSREHLLAPRSSPHPVVVGPVLIDTGATHTVLDLHRAVYPLGLQVHDRERLAFAGPRAAREVPIYEAQLHFPQFGLCPAPRRVAGVDLPGDFVALIGMDLLRGTRFVLHWGDDGLWMRWNDLGPPPP